jgi:Xaa-Pro dipeptidase
MPNFADFPQEEFNDRFNKLQRILRDRDLDALFLTTWENIYYLSGFHSASMWSLKDLPHGLVVKRDGTAALIVPVAPFLAEETSWVPNVKVYFRTSDATDLFKKTFADMGLSGTKVGAELGEMQAVKFSTGLFLDLLKNAGPIFVDGSQAIWDQRMRKSELEVSRIREAARIASRAIERAFANLKEDMTEREFARQVGRCMMEEGADGITYVMIQSGEKFWRRIGGSFPSERKIRKGDYVQVDFGAVFRHYNSDLNRLAILKQQPKRSEIDHWNLFVDANRKGTQAVRPGASIGSVFAAITRVFEEAGYPFRDRPYAGHGLGLEAHEPPLISPANETKITPGMVLAIEPSGVTNKEGWWANCEDDVVCTEAGVDRLSTVRQEIFVV